MDALDPISPAEFGPESRRLFSDFSMTAHATFPRPGKSDVTLSCSWATRRVAGKRPGLWRHGWWLMQIAWVGFWLCCQGKLPAAPAAPAPLDLGKLRAAAEAGNIASQLELAEALESDPASPERRTEAITWYQKAADAGNWHANLVLGIRRQAGDGVPLDPIRAAAHFEAASRAGSKRAPILLQILQADHGASKPEREEALKRLRSAADAGQVDAQIHLGQRVLKERAEGEVVAQARRWLQSASASGNGVGTYELSRLTSMYATTAAERTTSTNLLVLAAERGEPRALYASAKLHAFGALGMISPVRERAACLAAAQKGHVLAQYEVARLLVQGSGGRQDWRQAAHWYRQAALRGHAGAQFALASCYANGRGVEKDTRLAADWLTRAARGGNPAAIAWLARNGWSKTQISELQRQLESAALEILKERAMEALDQASSKAIDKVFGADPGVSVAYDTRSDDNENRRFQQEYDARAEYWRLHYELQTLKAAEFQQRLRQPNELGW